ncbi:MAG: glutathione S-transferase family protein [Pseudomonadota bacterium]
MKVYGASVSYYTGKLETYLRFKGLAYERASPYPDAARIKAAVGCIQHPMVERADGRWMSDSTPILLQLEQEHPQRSILPADPVVRFVALLIEDYADEWLWRPAMHYRWSYEHDRELLSRILTDELTTHLKLPRWLRRRTIRRRQLKGFVHNDGVTAANREHVEGGYLRCLALLQAVFAERPFLLGTRPSIADFGLMGPMLRHFGQDPTPAEIMRDRAPAVLAWVARMWNAGAMDAEGAFPEQVPADLAPLLEEVCQTHLVQLTENARAWGAQAPHFAMLVQGARYERLPVSRYRVYCLEQLRAGYSALSEQGREAVRGLLDDPAAAALWQGEAPAASGYDAEGRAPFNQAINVFDGGVPR